MHPESYLEKVSVALSSNLTYSNPSSLLFYHMKLLSNNQSISSKIVIILIEYQLTHTLYYLQFRELTGYTIIKLSVRGCLLELPLVPQKRL